MTSREWRGTSPSSSSRSGSGIHAAVEKSEVAAIEKARYRGVVAGTPADVAMLRQDYGINCDGSISPTLPGGG